MEIEKDARSGIREIKHLEIAMDDGVRLAARIWLPEGANGAPVPAILEYIPYRKNDKTLSRDWARAPYIASRDYAYVRVDLRGTGESEGVMLDEYTPRELHDGCDVIAWIASQPWCDGNVGMVGISWGGFNGLQIAAMRPAALKAVVSICSTDDRYADDIHYMGGTMLGDHLSWSSVMFGINSLPPDPYHVGERWRGMWIDRLERSGLWLKNWLGHQWRDDFWKHGSICEDHSRVEVPVYAVSGWADGYCRTVFRLLERLDSPCKGLVGPWAHRYPHQGVPGPAIDWLGEEVRWWDHWLKGVDTGIMDEPALRVFMQDHAPPRGHYAERPGRWIDEAGWPSTNVKRVSFSLGGDGRLSLGTSRCGEPVRISSPLWVGLCAGKWCSYGHPGDQPVDQRRDDAGSAVFETAPLDAPVEILGDASLVLQFKVDRPVAMAAARLVDVAPNGEATRVSYGVLNLTHRDGHERPSALSPGDVYHAEIPFKHVAQTFRKGHRIRLSLSTVYFPISWPSPTPVEMTIYPSDCSLTLPIRDVVDGEAPSFDPPRAGPPMNANIHKPPAYEWRVEEDRATGRMTIRVQEHEGEMTIPDNGLWIAGVGRETYEFDPADVGSVVARLDWTHEMRRDAWHVRTVSETRFSSDAESFYIDATLRAWESDELIHEQQWSERIARRLV